MKNKRLYLSGKGNEDGEKDLLGLQDGSSKAYEEILVQRNFSLAPWWVQGVNELSGF